MSRLIPTPIVDKNGRQTTVHKRADIPSPAAAGLGGIRPALGSVQKAENEHAVRLKGITSDSPSMVIGRLTGLIDHDDIDGFLASGRKTVNLPDDLIYDFLRQGIDAENAAALVALGMDNPNDVPGEDNLIINLKVVRGSGSYILRRKIDDVVDRLQENGVPAPVASKVIRNGLQDSHLDNNLSDEQLVQLFSKWTYKGTVGHEKRGNEQDQVIEGVLNGLIPFELTTLKMNELKGIEYELSHLATDRNGIGVSGRDREFYEKLQADRDYLVKVATKAATSMEGYTPMRTLDGLIEKHGMEVMELRNPQMAGVEIHLGNYQSYEIGVEAARYIEQVHDVMDKDSDSAYWMSGDRYSSHGGKQADRVYVRHADLLELREAGLSPEESYNMLVKHKLSKDQIIVARETGVGSTLASGVL